MTHNTPDPEMTKFFNFMDSYYTTTENGKKILESSNRVDQVQEELNSLKAQNRKIREFQITHAERIKRIRQEVEAKLDRLTENMREVDVEKRRLIVINVNKNELTLETVKKGDSEFQIFTKSLFYKSSGTQNFIPIFDISEYDHAWLSVFRSQRPAF